jgi:hypothetical protein
VTGHRRSISAMISSAQRTASDIAATVAGTRFPPSYCASFRAAKIGAAISRKQAAGASGARPLLHRNRGVLCQRRRGLAPAMPLQGGPKGRFALVECSKHPNPPRLPNPRRIGSQALRRELRKEEIHVVTDSIANFMADNPHTI